MMVRRSKLRRSASDRCQPSPSPGPRLTAAELETRSQRSEHHARQHQRTNHRWGIVRGLMLTAEGAGLRLSAGLGVDGRGRRLLVPHGLAVSPTAETPIGCYDAWLLSAETPAGDGRASGQHLRFAPHFVLAPAASQPIDPTDPTGWPVVDEPSAATWPIYLGRLAKGPEGWRSLGGRRPTASLATARWLRLGGPQLAIHPGPPGQRAISLGPADTSAIIDPARVCCKACQKERHDHEWLWFWDELGIALGNLVVEGDVILEGGPLRWPSPTLPPIRPGWRIYRAPPGEPNAPRQLRLELPMVDGEGDPAKGWAITDGSGDPADGGATVLRVTPEGGVHLRGDLVVHGRLDLPEAVLDPADPRFVSRAIKAYYDGLVFALLRADPTLNLETAVKAPEPVGSRWRFEVSAINLGVFDLEVAFKMVITMGLLVKQVFLAPNPVAAGDSVSEMVLVDSRPTQIDLTAIGNAEGQSTTARAAWPTPQGGGST